MSTDSQWATPTYQSNLNAAIRDVAIRLTSGLIYETWLSLETLYALLPPDCEPIVQAKYVEIAQVMNNIRSIQGIDIYDTRKKQHKINRTTLQRENFELFREIKKILFEKKWLVNDSNRPATRERSMKDLQITVDKAKYGGSE